MQMLLGSGDRRCLVAIATMISINIGSTASGGSDVGRVWSYETCYRTTLVELLYTNLLVRQIYSVSQKIPPPEIFSRFFPKRLGILSPILHAYYAFLSTLDYKFLVNYLQL